ncbi:hypothetical protein ACOMHN_052574 [Nucella lapillus]
MCVITQQPHFLATWEAKRIILRVNNVVGTMEKRRKCDSDTAQTQNYVDKLIPAAKERYAEKTVAIDGIDPYEIPKNSWLASPDNLPDVTYISLVNYFVYGKSAYTQDDFKAYKSLSSYKLFVSGWVRDVQSYMPAQCKNTVIAAKVLHSQRLNEKPLSPWLISSDDGTILSAHCTCMAGIGETCTHVGALCFTIDALVRTREKATCTGVAAYWKVPQGAKGVTPKPASEIDFASARSKKDQVDTLIEDEAATAYVCTKQKQMPVIPVPDADEMMTGLFRRLKLNSSNHTVLKVLPEFCGEYTSAMRINKLLLFARSSSNSLHLPPRVQGKPRLVTP